MNQACSIIIPNYNGEKLLQAFLPSVIRERENYQADCELIVVDDASSDNSIGLLQQHFPDVKLIRHSVNQGFAGAIHSGVAAARHGLIFLLNSDVELEAGCLNRLCQYFNDENTFAVNPLIVNQDGEINQSSWTRSHFVRGHLKLLPWQKEQLTQMQISQSGFLTLYCSGGSVMMRKSMFQELGGFCELYKPFYYEDFDLGLRAWYHGWSSHFDPLARVIHADGGTIEDHYKSALIKSTQRQNRYKLEWSHFSLGRLIFSTLPFSLLQLLGELLLFDKKNLLAFINAMQDLPAIRRERRILKSMPQKGYRLSDILTRTVNDQQ